MISTVQAEERIVAERAERQRLEAAAEQRTRAIDIFQRNKETIGAMMVQFDTLMSEGVYNVLFIGGTGRHPRGHRSPFYEARLLAQKAYALQRGGPLPYSDNDPAPAAGEFVSNAMNFYTQELHVPSGSSSTGSCSRCRTSPAPRSPSPTTSTSNTPTPTGGGTSPRSGSSAGARPSTSSTATPRPSRSSRSSTSRSRMSFANETPLDDVLKYIKQATTDADVQRHPDLRRSDRPPGSREVA